MDKEYFLKNIKFTYSGSDFDFQLSELSLEKGRLTCIIGPNGSGKSTFLRLCSGGEKGYSGTISLLNRNIRTFKPSELAKIVSYLPQDIEKNRNYLVEDIVMMGRYPHQENSFFPGKKDRNIVDSSLKLTGIYSFRGRNFASLSGGERKRVLIASILAQESDYIFLDEPTASLDLVGQSKIFSILKNVKNNMKAVIVATHNINLASIYSDEIILFSNGKILKKGSPEEVIKMEYLSVVYGEDIEIIDHPQVNGRKIVLPYTGESANG